LAIFEHPEWFPQNVLRRKITTSLVLHGIRKAPEVLAVSEDTKQTIMRIAGIEAEKIEVTYQGVLCHPRENGDPAKTNLKPLPDRFELDSRLRGNDKGSGKNYALILGTVEPRKQPSWVAGWWEEVNRSSGLDLVVAGPTGWGGEEQRLQHVAGKASWFHRLSDVDEVMKTELIKNAACVLVPSLHEGFGRVAMEAMVLGTPVIASNRGALPEVVVEGGRLLDPTDQEGWIRAIGQLIGSEAVRQGMVEAGQRQAQRFSWPKIAQEMLASLLAS
jgi:alpha-1,3-rhamnosyl/mannosyltransferase